jgi:hypothetical protein
VNGVRVVAEIPGEAVRSAAEFESRIRNAVGIRNERIARLRSNVAVSPGRRTQNVDAGDGERRDRAADGGIDLDASVTGNER